MRAYALLVALPLLLGVPLHAQEHQHGVAGMDVSAPTPPPADAPGNAPPPPVPTDHPADALFDGARMARARAALMTEGRWTGSAVQIDRLELRSGAGGEGYAWKGHAWHGSDLDKLVIASEGEGRFGKGAERVEVQALWRHAVSPWFNMETGLRQDFGPDPRRTYAVIGVEGLAPYWIETEAQLFVSHKGDLHARLAASHDLRLSGPLVLQGEAEVNLAFQDVPALGIGSGVERVELGARLRYEIRPEMAPYVGVNWERSFGGTARATRAAGESASAVTAVAGLRAFF